MDLDVYAAAHQAEWDRLDALIRRRGRLSGAEADELVLLYQRTATHLSVLRSAAPETMLLGRLSSLVARARSAVTGAHEPAWRDLARFFLVDFPAAVHQSRRWWMSTGLAFVVVATAIGAWVAGNPPVQAAIAAPEEIQQLVDHDFANYYSQHPAGSFAAQVWTNNAWVAAGCLVFGVLLGLPVLYLLWQNAASIGITGGLMASAGKADVFFGLITPHGLLELTAVFVAAGIGLRLGWTVIDPGPRRRVEALAERGRSAVGTALGLAVVLLVSGLIEAFVTPSPLPTWARISIGVLAELAFLTYVWALGRKVSDPPDADRGDTLPTAG